MDKSYVAVEFVCIVARAVAADETRERVHAAAGVKEMRTTTRHNSFACVPYTHTHAICYAWRWEKDTSNTNCGCDRIAIRFWSIPINRIANLLGIFHTVRIFLVMRFSVWFANTNPFRPCVRRMHILRFVYVLPANFRRLDFFCFVFCSRFPCIRLIFSLSQ